MIKFPDDPLIFTSPPDAVPPAPGVAPDADPPPFAVIVENVVAAPADVFPPPPPVAATLIRYTPAGTVQFPEPDAIDVIAPTPFSHGADGPRCAMLSGFVSSADMVAARRILFAPRSSLSKTT